MNKNLKLVINNSIKKYEEKFFFVRGELKIILDLYAKMVSNGSWKDGNLNGIVQEISYDEEGNLIGSFDGEMVMGVENGWGIETLYDNKDDSAGAKKRVENHMASPAAEEFMDRFEPLAWNYFGNVKQDLIDLTTPLGAKFQRYVGGFNHT